MSSPGVWDDARARIAAAAPCFGLTVAWPNEAFSLPVDPVPWLAVEITADVSAPLGLGAEVWGEEGEVHLHLMVPVGAGIAAGLGLRKALANLFRGVADAPAGLVYRDLRFDPVGLPDDSGLYRNLSLAVGYVYQDTIVNQALGTFMLGESILA